MRLRATLHLRNAKMIEARQARRLSQAVVAELAGVPLGDVGRLEQMNYRIPDVESKAAKVAGVLELALNDVMPEGAAGMTIQSVHVREFEADALQMAGEHTQRMTLPDPLAEITKAELVAGLDKALRTLTYRERYVLQMRFGLLKDHPGEEFSLAEVGRVFKIEKERVRQIQEKAIRKLQHPGRAKRLEGHLE